MEICTTDQITVYEPPVLVKLGEFLKDTHGFGNRAGESFAYFIIRA
jgi:hypothetical protein